MRARIAVLTIAAVAGGCSRKPSQQVPALGVAVATGRATELRVSPDGRFGAFLVDAQKPPLDGIPPQLRIGELRVIALDGGKAASVGAGVTNAPGGYLFSPDSRHLLFLAGYNAARSAGRLFVLALDPLGGGEPRAVGGEVTYMGTGAGGRLLVVIDDGTLKVGPIDAAELATVAAEVSQALVAPDGKGVYFKRRLSAGGGLYYAVLGEGGEPRRLSDQVGEFTLSPSGSEVAFAVRSKTVPSTYDLLVAGMPAGAARMVAPGVTEMAFSADGRWLGRVTGARPGVQGDLIVGPADGSKGNKVAERVQGFEFTRDGGAVVYLEAYDESARAGSLGVMTLPDGKPKRVGTRVPNFVLSPDGKVVAFLSRFIKPIYSVDLMLYRIGAEPDAEASKVHAGVFGYAFGEDGAFLMYRSGCVREGRACDLYELNLRQQEDPVKRAVGVYSFKASESGERLLLSYARIDSDAYDVAVLNRRSGALKTVDTRVQLPATFLDATGSKVAYAILTGERAGVHVASQGVP